IQFMKTKGIWPAAPRDTVVLSHVERLPDGRYLNVTQSIEHSGLPPRDAEGIVRMDAKIAGQIVGPSLDGNPGKCRVIQVADGDLRGWIPKSVIGFIATKAVPLSFKTLDRIVSELPKATESAAILLAESSDTSKGKAAAAAAVAAFRRPSLSIVTSPTAPSAATAGVVARRSGSSTPSFLTRIRRVLEWWSPFMITVLFAMRAWKEIKLRRAIAAAASGGGYP
ncbi:hypothetical protein BDK51DRAFT_31819, partial [Blyttiomyces helicus]